MDEIKNSLSKLLQKSEKNTEVELSILSNQHKITFPKYVNFLKYLNHKKNKKEMKIENKEYLNVIFNYKYDNLNNYRISIDGSKDIDDINKIIDGISHRNNSVIFMILYDKFKNNVSNLDGDNKTREQNDIIDLFDHGIRLRKSQEEKLNMNNYELEITDKNYVTFRMIKRVSLIVSETSEYVIRIDLSHTKTSKNIKNLKDINPMYELEIDVTFKTKPKDSSIDKITKIVMEELNDLLKVNQGSSKIMFPNESRTVLDNFFELLHPQDHNNTKDKPYRNFKDLPFMQSNSADIISLIDTIPSGYSITDKADGERYSMFIFNGNVYMISNNLEVKILDETFKNITKYNDSIFDGEYIFLPKYQKYIFLTFDCLAYKGKIVSNEPIHSKRIEKNKEICNLVFGQKDFYEKYSGEYDEKKILSFYEKSIIRYLKELDDRIKDKNYKNIISLKYFIFSLGLDKREIFMYMNLIWNIYTGINNQNYKLDGLIATPTEQIHTRINSEIKHKIYKIKFSEHNTIDFYVEFTKDPETGKILSVFDDSFYVDNEINYDKIKDVETEDTSNFIAKGKNYFVANLHVGETKGSHEIPTLFRPEDDNYKANLFITRGFPRDIEGNIILDKTVVEFSYINNPMIPKTFRWLPLRTRHDKTEFVKNYKRKYGNNSNIANKVWISILDGINITDIEALSKKESYEKQMNILKTKLTNSDVERQIKEEKYYSVVSKLAIGLKNFHNFLKSQIIYNYAYINNGNKLEVLDYSCGKGGDILKFFHARIKNYMGFDNVSDNLTAGRNGAISRYENYKTKYPQFPDMKFFVSDGSMPLDLKHQELFVKKDDIKSLKILRQYFDKKYKTFDVINCQFAVHYFFKNEESFSNLIDNFEKYTKSGGYVLLTCFDAEIVDKKFKEKNGVINIEFTTETGKIETIFSVIKKYDEYTGGLGQAIDVHLPVFDDDQYYTEYLVPKNLLVESMKSKNFRLVERDTFKNTFVKMSQFLNNYSQLESNPENRQFYAKSKKYYDVSEEINRKCHEYTNLNVYYVFQKK